MQRIATRAGGPGWADPWINTSSPFVSTKGERSGNSVGSVSSESTPAAHSGWHSSAAGAEAKYGAVAHELQSAFADGTLTRRAAPLFSFIDPDLKKWLPEIPASILRLMRVSLFPLVGDVQAPPASAGRTQFLEYVRVGAATQLLWWIWRARSCSYGKPGGLSSGTGEPFWTNVSANPVPSVSWGFCDACSQRRPHRTEPASYKDPGWPCPARFRSQSSPLAKTAITTRSPYRDRRHQ